MNATSKITSFTGERLPVTAKGQIVTIYFMTNCLWDRFSTIK